MVGSLCICYLSQSNAQQHTTAKVISVSQAADIWSLGVTLYAMVTGKVPWVSTSAIELQRKVLAEPLTYPARFQPTKQLRHLLSRMLDKDPVARITLQEVKVGF